MIKYKFTLVYILTVLSALFIAACDTVDSEKADSYSINGKITFVDSNFALSGGKYVVSSFHGDWPRHIPEQQMTIVPVKMNDSTILEYKYKLSNVPSGNSVVCLEYINSATNIARILGVYGCDTLRDTACTNDPPLRAFINTTSGVLNIDFKSFADTNNFIFTHQY